MLVSLSDLSVGETAVVSKIRVKEMDVLNRLKQLNIRMGVEVKLIQAEPGNPFLIGINDARIGVNFDLAEKIYVNVCPRRAGNSEMVGRLMPWRKGKKKQPCCENRNRR